MNETDKLANSTYKALIWFDFALYTNLSRFLHCVLSCICKVVVTREDDTLSMNAFKVMQILDWVPMPLCKSSPSSVLRLSIVAQTQTRMALSKPAHQLCHAIFLGTDVLTLLQLFKRQIHKVKLRNKMKVTNCFNRVQKTNAHMKIMTNNRIIV